MAQRTRYAMRGTTKREIRIYGYARRADVPVERADGTATVEDQTGTGFPIQDIVMLANSTCFPLTSNPQTLHMDFVIRADVTPSRVYYEWDSFNDTSAPILVTEDVPPLNATTTKGSYVQWFGAQGPTTRSFSTFNLAVDTSDGKKYTTPIFRPFDFPNCS
ncbi:hypothetical protein OF83DRAFT_1083299 [Amylostereum chailletii]|nr:hypothetical protein OF83DRAFT_1083299 [Amylostereum chailletii]